MAGGVADSPAVDDEVHVGVVDGGRLYDPLVDELTRGGMAVFRSSDSAIRTLALYIEGRLYAEQLRGGIGGGGRPLSA